MEALRYQVGNVPAGLPWRHGSGSEWRRILQLPSKLRFRRARICLFDPKQSQLRYFSHQAPAQPRGMRQLQPDRVVQRTAQAHHATSTGLEGLLTANSTRVHGAGAPLASAAHSSTANTNLQRRTRQTHFFTASSPQISQACASLPRRGTAMAVGEYGF